MKTNKTEEKKCECHCHGRSLMNGFCQSGRCQCPKACEHCQKEQPEECKHDGAHREVVVCDQCKEIIPEMKSSKSTPPQELRQEGWEKEFCSEFCQLGPEGHTWDWAIEAGYIECMDNDNNSYTKLKSFIKKIEQKARKEERKRCAEIVDDFKGFHGLTYSQTCELQQKILNTRNND